MKFNREQFARNEIELALESLKVNPDNELQRDRVAFWAIKLNNLDLAREYGTSKKMKKIIEQWKS